MEPSQAQQTLTWQISGMHCSSCSILIDEAVEELDGVTSSSTSLRKRRTKVAFDPSMCDADQIAAAIAAAGYQAVPTTEEAPAARRTWIPRTAR